MLLIHGRKDKRVVPLMTERMVEALEIEGKRHEVHWYDEEGHGWEKRENRRDAFERILAFLKANVLDEPLLATTARPARIASAIVTAMPTPMRTSPMLKTFASGSHAGSANTSVSGPSAGSATTMLFV